MRAPATALKALVPANAEEQQKAIQEQVRVAEDLHDKVIESPGMLREIRRKMDELARHYELLRSARDNPNRKSSESEIVGMNRVVSQMRALAISCAPYLGEYANAERAGDHLAAVPIAQMAPDVKYLNWLGDRVREDKPFVFYHAALALQNIADKCWTAAREQFVSTARRALAEVRHDKG